jgi:hypothetical protein
LSGEFWSRIRIMRICSWSGSEKTCSIFPHTQKS